MATLVRGGARTLGLRCHTEWGGVPREGREEKTLARTPVTLGGCERLGFDRMEAWADDEMAVAATGA